jgi:hypothetical protein
MSPAAVIDAQPQATTVEQPKPDEVFYRPSRRNDRVRFTPEMQAVFNREWGKKEAKLRSEYAGVLRDLFETVDIAKQLLSRCKDRLSVEDQVALLDGMEGIKRDWEAKWLKHSR